MVTVGRALVSVAIGRQVYITVLHSMRAGVALGIALLCVFSATRARAYSDPTLYAEPTDIGGGGGRWFTGSAADGFGCDVCHTGGSGPDVAIAGLPVDGFVPGAHYEVSIAWPPTAQLALIAEFTDEQRRGAGTLSLPRPEVTMEFERCALDEGGELPTALWDGEADRKLFSVIDCGAKSTRFRWTAPTTVTSPVWFNLGFVASNEDALPGGDGVTLVTRSLRAASMAMQDRVVAQGCSAATAGGRAPDARFGWLVLGVLMAGWGRARRAREVT